MKDQHLRMGSSEVLVIKNQQIRIFHNLLVMMNEDSITIQIFIIICSLKNRDQH